MKNKINNIYDFTNFNNEEDFNNMDENNKLLEILLNQCTTINVVCDLIYKSFIDKFRLRQKIYSLLQFIMIIAIIILKFLNYTSILYTICAIIATVWVRILLAVLVEIKKDKYYTQITKQKYEILNNIQDLFYNLSTKKDYTEEEKKIIMLRIGKASGVLKEDTKEEE